MGGLTYTDKRYKATAKGIDREVIHSLSTGYPQDTQKRQLFDGIPGVNSLTHTQGCQFIDAYPVMHQKSARKRGRGSPLLPYVTLLPFGNMARIMDYIVGQGLHENNP